MRFVSLALLLLALLGGPVSAAAQDSGDEAHAEAEEAELDALHHSADGFYLDFEPMGKVELPRMFVVRRADGAFGLDVFGSTHAAVESGRYVLDPEGEAHGGEHADDVTEDEHGGEAGHVPGEEPTVAHLEGPEGEADLQLIGGDPLEVGIVPSEGEIVADLSVTRHTVFMGLAALLLLLVFLPIGAKYRRGIGRETAPKGRLQNSMEATVIYVREEIAKPTMGDKYPKYLPYLLTAFFFILVGNLLGLFPYGATMTSNIAVTAVLATFTFVITQFAGTKDYWMHIFNPPGVPLLVKPIMIPIELLGIFTKPFALAIRLFANMTAGHLVILSLIGLIFAFANLFGAAVGWGTSIAAVPMTLFVYCLELLIAFIQAYVFTILSALFIGMATAEHEHEHDHDHSEDHGISAHDIAVSQASGNGQVRKSHERTVGTEVAMAA